MNPYYESNGVQIFLGDCREVMPQLEPVHAIITDPPYGLEFMGKEWDAPWKSNWQNGGGFSKPGIGDRPTAWPSFSTNSLFGAANPTCSVCGGRARGAKKCECSEPQWKPIGKRRNPENEGLPDDMTGSGKTSQMAGYQAWCLDWATEALRVIRPGGHILSFGGSRTYHRMACAIEDAGFEIRDQIMWIYGSGFPKSKNLDGNWRGYGTALKPSHEPIVVARKPLTGTVAANALQHGTGALNIDGCRIDSGPSEGGAISGGTAFGQGSGWNEHVNRATGIDRTMSQGRWPANMIHDGSDEVVEAFPDADGQQGDVLGHNKDRQSPNGCYGKMAPATDHVARLDSGSAARFFYTAKADKGERGTDNNHPTVKPLDLMRYLCKLLAPPSGGILLDPFAGSGSTIIAGRRFYDKTIGIEKEEKYCEIIATRLSQEILDFEMEMF